MTTYLRAIEPTDPPTSDWCSFEYAQPIYPPDIAIRALDDAAGKQIGEYEAKVAEMVTAHFAESDTLRLIGPVDFDTNKQLSLAADCLERLIEAKPEYGFADVLVDSLRQYVSTHGYDYREVLAAVDMFAAIVPEKGMDEAVLETFMLLQDKEQLVTIPSKCADLIADGSATRFQREVYIQSRLFLEYLKEKGEPIPF